jgi:hypothetical protein
MFSTSKSSYSEKFWTGLNGCPKQIPAASKQSWTGFFRDSPRKILQPNDLTVKHLQTGWWLTYASEKYEFVNGFRMTSLFYVMENNPVMFETTNQRTMM